MMTLRSEPRPTGPRGGGRRRGLGGFLGRKAVMVTGAGGSIGSELCREIARFSPSRLLLVERAEGALFTIHRELTGSWPDLPILPLLADVGDRSRMRVLFAFHRPEIVAHAAAHKHVPMMESHPCEAIKNNIVATRVLAELAGETGVECFILISSDKAVRPTSVVGASKRVTELLVQELDRCHATRYVAGPGRGAGADERVGRGGEPWRDPRVPDRVPPPKPAWTAPAWGLCAGVFPAPFMGSVLRFTFAFASSYDPGSKKALLSREDG